MDIIAWDVSGEPEITFELPTITWGAPSNGPNPGFLRTRTCALSTDSQSPLAATDWGDNSLSAINMMSGDFDWQVENSQGLYEQLLMAYILIDESSEQILAYDSDRQLFDIIKIEDGSIWGQTSELSNDYDEMKIIGRYHNDYRRLAVRYDDEIQIYSFGEPIIVAADASPSLPSDYNFTIYPNPFNPTATISFSLPVYEQVKLSIYNTLGQQVALLTNEQFGPGNHTITFDAADLPSGIYFAHLTAGSVQSTKKLVLLK
jgi:formylmethanofuran dehydrogenase subunit D